MKKLTSIFALTILLSAPLLLANLHKSNQATETAIIKIALMDGDQYWEDGQYWNTDELWEGDNNSKIGNEGDTILQEIPDQPIKK